ncbi:MAG TPA: alpha/beta fold hydrolase [Pseudogracilibacillus sp.]|nr:alpha/beta fold hydrolase [Pseudogracilibacillus sp.]
MIHLMETTLKDIPVLHIVNAQDYDKVLPTVIYYHGYNGEKESSLTLAYKIVEKGYRVILPDCMYHGSRSKGMSNTEFDLAFWDVVMQSIEELADLSDALVEKGYSTKDRIGIGGTSMGGIISYGALVRYDWIKTAAVLMGTPYMTDYAKALIKEFNKVNEHQVTKEVEHDVMESLSSYDLSLHPNALNNRPLFIWHGEEDKVVPYKYSPSFYESIKEYYDSLENIQFSSENGRAHHVSKRSMNEAAAWFEKHL